MGASKSPYAAPGSCPAASRSSLVSSEALMSALLKALNGVAAAAGRGRAPLVGPTEAEAGSLSSLDTCTKFTDYSYELLPLTIGSSRDDE